MDCIESGIYITKIKLSVTGVILAFDLKAFVVLSKAQAAAAIVCTILAIIFLAALL